MQGHDSLDWPTVEQEEATIKAFKELGVKVHITEMEISVLPFPTAQQTADVNMRAKADPKLNPYAAGLTPEVEKQLTKRYRELFSVFAKHSDTVERVTFWGVTDRDSWKNNWPIFGRTDYPLLFDRAGKPKPAFDAVIQAAGK